MTTKEALERLKQPFSATPDTDSYFDAKEVAIKSLEKDLSIIKELKDIKTKLEELEFDDFDGNLVLPAWKVYEIIDKHIKEDK